MSAGGALAVRQTNLAYRLRNTRPGFARLAANAMARYNAARNRFNRYSTFARRATRSRQASRRFSKFQSRRKNTSSGLGVTTQHDSRLIYRKRRMPRGRRRRWRSFKNKVLAVAEKDLGSQQVVFNRSIISSNVVPGRQNFTEAALYGFTSDGSHLNDMRAIRDIINAAATTPATGLKVAESSKVMFQSGVLDLTIRNTSTNNGQPDSLARLEVDVYELSIGHESGDNTQNFTSLGAMLLNDDIEVDPIGGTAAATSLNILYRGCTPFDLSYALSEFRIKIWKKTKYQLSNGDQVTYQIRDPRRHSMTLKELGDGTSGFNKPGLTRSVCIIAKLGPGLTTGPIGTPNVFQENLTLGITRKYMFKVENWTEDRSAYFANL